MELIQLQIYLLLVILVFVSFLYRTLRIWRLGLSERVEAVAWYARFVKAFGSWLLGCRDISGFLVLGEIVGCIEALAAFVEDK